ncbi:hybrid sensor histidine kinase/response regulator [Loktanella fryxellensis]|uniref:hybrid sensor histidine kinase/response regulator n=1 Tax=Loktanella fryxellensis TaxID=245187 RepID=UPI0015A6FEE8|nr:ATP-binding protein [Loktanella fryxellensis]
MALATQVLIGLVVVLIAMTAYLFFALRDRQQMMQESVREDAMWAVFQTHRESSRLVESLLLAQTDPTTTARDRVSLNFDLVFSRMRLLETGLLTSSFTGATDLQAAATALRARILAMAQTIDAIKADGIGFAAAVPDLITDARQIQSDGNALVNATNERLSAARAADRARKIATYGTLAAVVAITGTVFVGIMILQFIQLRIIRLTGRQLHDLSRRNAQSAAEAEAASAAKTLFLASMSHEMRTPLTGIIGAADLLSGTGLSGTQARHALTIRRSGHILLDVINDILDFSSLDATGVSYTTGPVVLPDLAEVLQDVFRQRIADAGLTFDLAFPPLVVTTDDVRLRQVLLNLIGNAIKFTPDGSVRVTAELVDATTLRIAVTDSGIGIAADLQSRLFQDFSRIETSARKFAGTGLGLAISRRIVTGMGGRIGVDSTPSRGSTFWLELPVTVAGPAPAQSEPPLQRYRTGMRCVGSVLLVEDNDINREIAEALLAGFGVHVATAHDGQQALDTLGPAAFDLIIMDMQMPVMDGIAATRALRQRGCRTPIVGLTANAFADDRQRCLDAGMDGFVSKPITRDKIAEILSAWLTVTSPGKQEDAAAPQTPAPPLIDPDQRTAMIGCLGPQTYTAMLAQLRDDAARLETMGDDAGSALHAGVWDDRLHALKGSAATLGLTGVSRRAQDLRDPDGPRTSAIIGALLALIDASIVEARVDPTDAVAA